VTPGGRDAAGNEAARMRELLGIARAKKLRPVGGG
jgi:hypothetical protein